MTRAEDLPDVCGEWYTGPTGAGKTYHALQKYGRDKCYMKDPSNKWWDGYNPHQHEYVILDDFDKGHAGNGYYLKIWGDKYPFIAEIKGSAMMIRPKKIIVTSNWAPRELWDHNNSLEPILRRFTIHRFSISEMRERTRFPEEVEVTPFDMEMEEPILPPPLSPPQERAIINPLALEYDNFNLDLAFLDNI